MATVIQIKRNTGTTAPTTSNLSEGELAYTQDRTGDGASSKLYIESVDSGAAAVIHEIGGKFFTDIIKGDAPTPSNFIVGNSSTAGGSIQFREDTDNGTNFIGLKGPDAVTTNVTFTLPDADGSTGQFLKTDGSGNLAFQTVTSSFTLSADSGTDDSFSTGETLTFTGGEGIDTTVSDNAITIAGEDASTSNKGIASFSSSYFSVSSGAVSIADSFLVTEAEGIGSNDNDTTVPTSAAVKDYVDTNITAQDLDVAGDSGTGAVDLDSQSLTIAGTANEIETSASGQTITVGLPDDVTIGGGLTVTGNLTVNGTQTTVNSTTVTIDDPIFVIGGDTAPASDDNLDRGIEFRWHDGSTAKLGFFGFDDSTGKFTFVPEATDSSSVISGTKGDLDIGALSLAGSIDSYAGSAPTDGQLLIGDTASGVFDAATLTAGSNGVTITNGAGAITIENDLATTSTVGVASFNSSNFTVTSGDVEISAIDGGTY